MKKRTLLTLLLIILLVSLALLFRANSRNIVLQGEVDASEVIVSSKAGGRVSRHHVQRGDNVQAGQLLMELESPELLAQLRAAAAVRDQAQARLDLSMNGTREENIRHLEAMLGDAQATYRNAQAQWQRSNNIARQGYISAQERDNARQVRDSARDKVNAAQANLDEALKGDRSEQRAGYAAQLRQAEQSLLEVKAQADELQVLAPVAGEVGPIPADVGELMNAGSPLLTLVRLQQPWFVFYLREDILAQVKKGDKIMLRVPALNHQQISAEVRYIAPLGDYATRRATRATGDFDLKTFEVRLYPSEPTSGLRQGMSALWLWQQ